MPKGFDFGCNIFAYIEVLLFSVKFKLFFCSSSISMVKFASVIIWFLFLFLSKD